MTMQTRKDIVVRSELGVIKTPREVVIDATEQAKLLMDIVESRQIYQEIEGKKYLEVEAWQTIGAFNRVHALTDFVNPMKEGDAITGYEAQVSLWKDGERIGQGIMTCGLDEFPCRGKEGQAKHKAARSAAQTWAESKAYRMNFAYIAVLAGYQPTPAEEMTGGNKPEDKSHWCPIHDIAFNEFSKGKSKWWAHKTDDGQWCNEAKVKKEQENTPQASPNEQGGQGKGEQIEITNPIATTTLTTEPTTLQELLTWCASHGKTFTPSWVCKELNVKAPTEIKDIPNAVATLKKTSGWKY